MSKVKEWFQEARKYQSVHHLMGVDCIFYKGFKISNPKGMYIVQDIRFSNMYRSPSSKCMDIFNEHGFIKGADIICFERNKERVEVYKRKAEIQYDKRKKAEKELKRRKDVRLNEKRIRNANRKIEEYIDHMFLYQTRINQHKDKYNLN